MKGSAVLFFGVLDFRGWLERNRSCLRVWGGLGFLGLVTVFYHAMSVRKGLTREMHRLRHSAVEVLRIGRVQINGLAVATVAAKVVMGVGVQVVIVARRMT